MPVSAIFYDFEEKIVIAEGHNMTNITGNNSMHAEFVCIDYISNILKKDKDFFKRCIVIVSCEPCIMCAYALGLLGKFL